MERDLNIQELAIAVAAKNHNPTVLTPDFLKYSGIVPDDWELAQQPVTSQRASQVIFQNGVSIIAQPQQIVFSESIAEKNVEDVHAPQVATKYLQTLPKVEYQAVRIMFRECVSFQRLQQKAVENNYIVKTLLAPGPWLEFGNSPVKASIQFEYTLERCECQVSVNQGTINLPETEAISVVVFSANFNYEIAENGFNERGQALCQRIDNWQADRETFIELVNTKFLQVNKSSIR